MPQGSRNYLHGNAIIEKLAHASVGFNAAKTEFVLPYKLGYLPVPELALAKADSAYAAGLVNAQDWVQVQFYTFHQRRLQRPK